MKQLFFFFTALLILSSCNKKTKNMVYTSPVVAERQYIDYDSETLVENHVTEDELQGAAIAIDSEIRIYLNDTRSSQVDGETTRFLRPVALSKGHVGIQEVKRWNINGNDIYPKWGFWTPEDTTSWGQSLPPLLFRYDKYEGNFHLVFKTEIENGQRVYVQDSEGRYMLLGKPGKEYPVDLEEEPFLTRMVLNINEVPTVISGRNYNDTR